MQMAVMNVSIMHMTDINVSVMQMADNADGI